MLAEIAHAAEESGLWNEVTEILSDPGHVVAEVIWSSGEFIVASVLTVLWHKRHDRKRHGAGVSTST